MSNKKRTVEHFPRMKVRGERNRRLAPFLRAKGMFGRLSANANQARQAMINLRELLEIE